MKGHDYRYFITGAALTCSCFEVTDQGIQWAEAGLLLLGLAIAPYGKGRVFYCDIMAVEMSSQTYTSYFRFLLRDPLRLPTYLIT